MKIIVVASTIIPGNSLGIEHFTYRLVKGLCEYYPQNEYIILIPRGTLEAWSLRVPQKKNVTFVPMRFSPTIRGALNVVHPRFSNAVYSFLKNQKYIRLIFRRLRLFELSFVLRQQRPDIVYSPLHVESLIFGEGKTVISVHDLREIMPEFYDKERAQSLKANILNSHGIVVAWKHPYEQLIAMFPLQKSKTYLIPFPIPITGRDDSFKENEEQQEIILFASALREQKNHINLLRAMPEIIKARSSQRGHVLLVCAGTCHSPMYEILKKEVSKLGLEENVKFTGFISDAELREFYERSTMIVSPTLWEAASGAVFEAFSFEKPVACSRIPPTISQVEQAGAFVNYFDPANPKDIARAVIQVLENPAPFILGSHNGAKYLRSLNWETTARSYMEVFRDVISKK